MTSSTGNFHFLTREYPLLANLCQSAEYHLYADPTVSLVKLRLFGEKLTERLVTLHGLTAPTTDNFHNRLTLLKEENILPDTVADLLFAIKNRGNIAVHQHKGTTNDALSALLGAFRVGKWFLESYGTQDYAELSTQVFKKPPQVDAQSLLDKLQQEYARLEQDFQTIQAKHTALSQAAEQKLKLKALKAASHIELTEAETRVLIDEQLRKAGWEVDTENLRWAKGARPQRGRNLAIAELPCGSLFADYALFIGLELYGLVEAKKQAREVISDVGQAKAYGMSVQEIENVKLLDNWGQYRVPFLFSTNGRPYHKELETKSGIWFLDARKPTNHPRALRGWFSPADLKNLLEQDISSATQKLANEPVDYLTDPNGLALRYYQVEAIQAVEEKISTSAPDDRRALIAMATGTGKTRTIIGLCYRLIRSGRFRRILFLVDRQILGTQANDDFKDYKVHQAMTFNQIYDLKGMLAKTPDPETKVHFATVQGMVQRILYPGENELPPPVGAYDCIIVDEAHRGYILDREMDDEEIHFKNQDDYISKYKAVLDYFDAFRIGLTATPALHTSRIFGKPVYRYTYRQAVLDGYLIDHEPPYQIKTRLNQEGILWEKGEKPKAYDPKTGKVIELAELEDELKIEVDGFNRVVITEPFNETVAEELARLLNPYSREKTLIFAANDEHADLVVKKLKEAFEETGVEIDDDAILKITGKTYQVSKAVARFKNEDYPNIVVTVDLLTTGVDVPEICNLVFLRRVRSRILFEQMLGRATRRADHIGKEVFRIYDAVRLYEALEDVTEMRPVVVNTQATFDQLVGELEHIEDEETLQRQLEQLVAKLVRKQKTIAGQDENRLQFERLSGGKSPEQFIQELREKPIPEAAALARNHHLLFAAIDHMKGVQYPQLISDQIDTWQETTQGYGPAQKPADYLDSLRQYVEDNRNKITALDLLCTRPSALTRKSLKELRATLSDKGFTEEYVRSAWKNARNEDIAADIIAYIRALAIGTAVETPQQRLDRAFRTLKVARSWTKIQSDWLDRIRTQLEKETLLDKELFEQEPFKSDGGYQRLNKIFQNDLDFVIKTVNENLFAQTA